MAGALGETVWRGLRMRRPPGPGHRYTGGGAARTAWIPPRPAPPPRGPDGAVATPGPPCRPDPPVTASGRGPGLGLLILWDS